MWGVYCFANVGRSVGRSVCLSVGRSTKCCPDDNSRTLGPRIMKLHRELGYDEQRKPIVFEVSMVKGQGHQDMET